MMFSNQLSRLRKEMKITQELLAEKCDVSRQAVAKWESGESLPSIYKLIEIAELFNVNKSTVRRHLKNIFDDVMSFFGNFATTSSDGKNYNTKIYNLDSIISVGYRVNSKHITHFRKWATKS